ncbi:hypothetical protein BDA99DRAFT_544556, partial [Phascolomyces articulosus]
DKEEEESAPPSLFAGQVLYYFEHDLRTKGLHRFAMVRYYGQLSSQHLVDTTGVELWKDSFDELSHYSILPIARIYAPFAYAKYKMGNRLAAIPLEPKFHLN